jgi:DNA-binding response OmpR family regulator
MGVMAQVLLVDGEPDLLAVLDLNLRTAGFETALVTTGEARLRARPARDRARRGLSAGPAE